MGAAERQTQAEIRPLRISKARFQADASPDPDLKKTRIAPAVGAKTSNLRSFWSDMEKSDVVAPSPERSPAARFKTWSPKDTSPKESRDLRDSPSSSLRERQSHESFTPRKFREWSPVDNASPKPPAMAATAVDSLPFRGSRTGSVRGPRYSPQIPNTPIQTQAEVEEAADRPDSPSKRVTFNNSAQVIQYEMPTPELTTSSDNGSDNDNDNDDNDDSFESVPVIEPALARSDSLQGLRRPLPRIPRSMSTETITEDENSIQVKAKVSPLSPVQDSVLDSSSFSQSDSSRSLERAAEPDTSFLNSLAGQDVLESLDIPETTLERKESLMESERKVRTETSQVSLRSRTSQEIIRTMSTRRRSLNAALETSSRKFASPVKADDTKPVSAARAAPPSDQDWFEFETGAISPSPPRIRTSNSLLGLDGLSSSLVANDESNESFEQELEREQMDAINAHKPLSPMLPAIKREPSEISAQVPASLASQGLPMRPELSPPKVKAEPDFSLIEKESFTGSSSSSHESPVPSLDHAAENSPYSTGDIESPGKGPDQDRDNSTGPYDNRSSILQFSPLASDFAAEFSDMLSRDLTDKSLALDRAMSLDPNLSGRDRTMDTKEDQDSDHDNEVQQPSIRASGSRLKTRPSLTPLDVARIPEAKRSASASSSSSHILQQLSAVPVPILQLDDTIHDDADSLFDNLDEEFDRMFQVQKRGYTLRENSSLVVASSRRVSSGNGSGSAGGRRVSGPVKRIASNSRVNPSEPIAEDATEPQLALGSSIKQAPGTKRDSLAPGDRGRLFVRVMTLKDVNLPTIETKQAKINLTLDNGVHCITTPLQPLRAGSATLFDHEFELTVGDDLEFILTFKASYNRPSNPPSRQVSALMPVAPVQTGSSTTSRAKQGLSRLFKKRDVSGSSTNGRATPIPSPMVQSQSTVVPNDKWHGLMATDGSFARCYMSLSQYRDQIYGKPMTFDLACFNEWAKGREPYTVGHLQVQMMYVPRVSRSEQLPTSINQAMQQLADVKAEDSLHMEGALSQLGGDCKYWRRRFFALEGLVLTAFSDTSRRPRASINLAKAVAIVYDKSQLTEPVVQSAKNRRKSGFAQEEEGYVFVDEGFRLQFANGEVIDFYADTQDAKQAWVKVLSQALDPTRVAVAAKPWACHVVSQDRT